jgi:hypothetical protein
VIGIVAQSPSVEDQENCWTHLVAHVPFCSAAGGQDCQKPVNPMNNLDKCYDFLTAAQARDGVRY